MSTTTDAAPAPAGAPSPPGALNIDPRLHHIQDDQERSNSNAGASSSSAVGDDPEKTAQLHALYSRQRHHEHSEYSDDVQHLLKTLPPNALPPNLAAPDLYQDEGVPDSSDEYGPTGQQSPDVDPATGRRKRDGSNAEDWSRIRKDNHKEVERRRRGTINQGINELSALMPSGGSADKAKGAILSRAVTYIRTLKENETRNIEKWTLEKLLMDQAMSELQATIDETRRRWEEERQKTAQLEGEVAELRAQLAGASEQGSGSAKRARME